MRESLMGWVWKQLLIIDHCLSTPLRFWIVGQIIFELLRCKPAATRRKNNTLSPWIRFHLIIIPREFPEMHKSSQVHLYGISVSTSPNPQNIKTTSIANNIPNDFKFKLRYWSQLHYMVITFYNNHLGRNLFSKFSIFSHLCWFNTGN